MWDLRLTLITASFMLTCDRSVEDTVSSAARAASAGTGGWGGGAIMCAMAPSPVDGSCPEGFWHYDDEMCGRDFSGGAGGSMFACHQTGDELCYRYCQSDADCIDPCFPTCRTLELFAKGDCCTGCFADMARVCGNDRVPRGCG